MSMNDINSEENIKKLIEKYKESKKIRGMDIFSKVKFLLENDIEYGYENIIEHIFRKNDPQFKDLIKINQAIETRGVSYMYMRKDPEEYKIANNEYIYLDGDKFLGIADRKLIIGNLETKQVFFKHLSSLHFFTNTDTESEIKNKDKVYFDNCNENFNFFYAIKPKDKTAISFRRNAESIQFLSHETINLAKYTEQGKIITNHGSYFSKLEFNHNNELTSYTLNDKLRAVLRSHKIETSVIEEVMKKLKETNNTTELEQTFNEYKELFLLTNDVDLDKYSNFTASIESIKKELPKIDELFYSGKGKHKVNKEEIRKASLKEKSEIIKNYTSHKQPEQTRVALAALNKPVTTLYLYEANGDELFDVIFNSFNEVKIALVKSLEIQNIKNKKMETLKNR